MYCVYPAIVNTEIILFFQIYFWCLVLRIHSCVNLFSDDAVCLNRYTYEYCNNRDILNCMPLMFSVVFFFNLFHIPHLGHGKYNIFHSKLQIFSLSSSSNITDVVWPKTVGNLFPVNGDIALSHWQYSCFIYQDNRTFKTVINTFCVLFLCNVIYDVTRYIWCWVLFAASSVPLALCSRFCPICFQ